MVSILMIKHQKKNKLKKRLEDAIEQPKARQWIYLGMISGRIISTFMINNNQFAIVTGGKLITYDLTNDESKLLMNFESRAHNIRLGDAMACCDVKNKLIYIYNRNYSWRNNDEETLFVINYETKTIQTIRNRHSSWHVGSGFKLRLICNQLHVIGGCNDRHLVLNNKTNQFDIFYSFNEYPNWESCIIIDSKNKLLVMGDDGWIFYEYNMLDRKWKQIDIKLKQLAGMKVCVVTKNEEYAILMGGFDIYILELNNFKLYKSVIVPANRITGRDQPIIAPSENNGRDELSVFGYVRDCFESEETTGFNIFPPYYLIKLMQRYCTFEFVHVFEMIGWNFEHRKIGINNIMNNMIPVN
eukprot:322980_1